MFGLILACAFAADTPTINAKALNPPIKARFIKAPPFRQENATLFIGSINNNKIKKAEPFREAGFQSGSRKIFVKAASFVPAKNPAADDFGGGAFVHGGATASVNSRRVSRRLGLLRGSMAAPAAVTMSILRITASSPGPSTNPAALTF